MLYLSYLFEEKYDPPYGIDILKSKYPTLSNDPVHKWRAETGIELIHKEPTKKEQLRIYKNWKLMTNKQKTISDKKSLEIFGITNMEHHNQIMKE